MGSMITLGVDKLDIDWGKNDSFVTHSALFLPSDVGLIPYYYADDVVEIKEGFSRTLNSIKRRLDLLGYSFQALPRKYDEYLDLVPDCDPDVAISFEQIRSIVSSIELEKVSLDSEYRCTFFENLEPYLILRLFAENEKNANHCVQWRFADVVDGGWVGRDEISTPLPDALTILVVTEGSSDSFIIERAMAALCPDIADFFHFVDMEEHYPFTGTGNLFRFCQGLSRIKIQNNVLVIFDNDAAGVEKFEQSRNLNRPKNLHICRLPDHEFFSSFKTIGPNGASKENINGSAVAIECFLDLSTISESDSCVRWTSYNRELQRYQGEIEGKDGLVRAFKNANLTNGSYDTSRLKFLLDYLVGEWVENAA